MRQTKRTFVQHTFYDRTGIRNYLENQARKGWILERISNFGWIFRRIEPKELRYEVTYFPRASVFDPEPSDQELSFQEFCEYTGWQLAAANGQLQIFYNDKENPTPIETDPVLEVETIHKATKRGYLPSIFLLMIVGIMNACLFFYRLAVDPIEIFSSTSNLYSGVCWFVMLLLTSVDVIHYYRWYRRAKRVAEDEGTFQQTTSLRGFHLMVLAIIVAATVSMLLSLGGAKNWIIYVASLAVMLLSVVVCIAFSNWLKRKKVSTKWNRLLTYGLTVVISFGIAIVMIIVIVNGVSDGWLSRESKEGFQYREDLYLEDSEELPLTVEQLMGREELEREKYRYEWYEQSSILMEEFRGIQNPGRNYLDEPRMEYTVWLVKCSLLYDWSLNHLLEPQDSWSEDIYGNIHYDTYQAVAATPWGAQQAYRLYQGEYAKDQYLICYEDQIMEIQVDWELSEEQMAMIGEALRR